MSLKKKAFLDTQLDIGQNLSKSPYVEGFTSGLKAALIGGPVAATHALITGGKHPLLAGGLGALGAGLVFGLAGAAKQNFQNKMKESELRWYLRNTKQNHPYEFMPPRPDMERTFPVLRPEPLSRNPEDVGVY